MTEQDQKQLGTTLWGIADTLRGAMNADDRYKRGDTRQSCGYATGNEVRFLDALHHLLLKNHQTDASKENNKWG